jgi:hypothetical protein
VPAPLCCHGSLALQLALLVPPVVAQDNLRLPGLQSRQLDASPRPGLEQLDAGLEHMAPSL